MKAAFISDIQGCRLTAQEREWLKHPNLSGLIFFTRHFETVAQLKELIDEVKAINPSLLMTVDHEGGRVQRFREGFTRVPAMGKIGALKESNHTKEQLAEAAAVVLAYELMEVGIDLTYAPVLDVNYERNQVIGDRGFGGGRDAIVPLAKAFIGGLKAMGFAAIGKHFPGHGWVELDSHIACPVDERQYDEIMREDGAVFTDLMSSLDWMMPAHVVYEKCDSEPAGFSSYWLQNVLRGQLKYNGRIVSDDLSMQGAAVKGGYAERAQAALNAGCDVLLACNHVEATEEILSFLQGNGVAPLDLTAYRPEYSVLAAAKGRYEIAIKLLEDTGLI